MLRIVLLAGTTFVLVNCTASSVNRIPRLGSEPTPAQDSLLDKTPEAIAAELAHADLTMKEARERAASYVAQAAAKVGRESSLTGDVALAAASGLLLRGDGAHAAVLARQAREIFAADAVRNPTVAPSNKLARAAQMAGEALEAIGDAEGARDSYREARLLLEVVEGFDAERTQTVRLREARLAIVLGQLADAVKLISGLTGPEHEAAGQIERIFLAQRRGAHGEAEMRYEQVLENLQRAELSDPLTAQQVRLDLWLRLERELVSLDSRWKDRAFLRQQTPILIAAGRDPLTRVSALGLLAWYWAPHDRETAHQLYRQADEAWWSLRRDVFSSSTDETRLAFAQRASRFYDNYLDFILTSAPAPPIDAAATALTILVQGRGLVLSEAFRGQLTQHDPKMTPFQMKRGALLSTIAAEYLKLQGADGYAERVVLEQRLREHEDALRALPEPSMTEAGPRPEQDTTMASLCSGLDRNSLLLAVFLYGSSAQPALGRIMLEPKACRATFRNLASADLLLPALRTLAVSLRAPFPRGVASVEEIVRSNKEIGLLATQIAQTLWSSLDPWPVSSLYVFWDPNLPQLPLEVLPAPGSQELLVRRTAVTYLTTLHGLLRESPPRAVGATVFGAPEYGPIARTPAGSMDALHSFVSTGGMAEEAQRTTDAFTRHGIPTITRVGSQASEEAFRKDSRGRRYISVATHGYFLGSEELPGAGQVTRGFQHDTLAGGESAPTSPPAGPSATLFQRRMALLHPLLRAGLAFAGANQRQNARAEDDGHLTALEVSALDLRGAELVILSACETGVGDRVHNEGVMGLNRAMLSAGAEGVGMSLWSVSDIETTELVSGWVAGVAARERAAVALQRAKIALMEQLVKRDGVAHPYFWSAMVYSR